MTVGAIVDFLDEVVDLQTEDKEDQVYMATQEDFDNF